MSLRGRLKLVYSRELLSPLIKMFDRRKSSINFINFERFHFLDKSRESRKRINHPPPPQYSFVGEKLRMTTPPALQCALFCGGARCKYETPDHWAAHQCAIQGIYSDWITDDLLAMARPSTASIAARNVIQQFHSWGIRTIINLQTAGEHSSCGPPLTSSGFTYDPGVFMENDIYYYNFAWKDYGEASLSGLLDMVKVVSFSLAEGRVAIHCHAGIGRTGVLIASYLVYSMRVRANDAIRLVRRRRARAVQTSGQILCVQQFEHYLLPQTVLFSSAEELPGLTKDRKTSEFTLRQHLYRQRTVLHGLEERVFRDLPKIVHTICERLLKLCGCRDSFGLDFRVRSRPFTRSFLVFRMRTTQRQEPPSPEEDSTIEYSVPALPMLEWRDPIEEDIEQNLECVSRIIQSNKTTLAAVHIYDALMVDHKKLPEDRRKYLKHFRYDLNQRHGAFERINEENDPAILTGLLFEWLEGLKKPVLDRLDLSLIISKSELVEPCVRNLKLEDLILIEYLLRFVVRLRPLCAKKRLDILRRLLASLTQQSVQVGGQTLPSKDFQKLREGTLNHAMNFLLRLLVELQKDMASPGSDDGDVVVPRKAMKGPRVWKP